jgi:hypothetical protein
MVLPATLTTPPIVATAAESLGQSELPVLQTEGFSATVDAFAGEEDNDASTPRMRLWFLSLLGSQQAVKALWARLVRGDVATMRFPAPGGLGRARFCALAPEGPRRWRFYTAGLPASAGYQGVLVPEAARFSTERAEFVLLPRNIEEAPALHYRFVNRRLDVPIHPAWARWLWERALRTGEAVPLEAAGLLAYRCAPIVEPLASDLSAAVRRGELDIPAGAGASATTGEHERVGSGNGNRNRRAARSHDLQSHKTRGRCSTAAGLR